MENISSIKNTPFSKTSYKFSDLIFQEISCSIYLNRLGNDHTFSYNLIIQLFFMITCELADGVCSSKTIIIKIMKLEDGQCKHTNIFKVVRLQGGHQFIDIPEILHNTSKQQLNSIKRYTEIIYRDQIYSTEDIYLFSGECVKKDKNRSEKKTFLEISQSSDSSNIQNKSSNLDEYLKGKKVCFFRKKNRFGFENAKRNTKNIPKNFCKAFINYMQQQQNKDSFEWNNVMQTMERLFKTNKFNNILMGKILSNTKMAVYFKKFLETQAVQWINNSKITDKQVHLQAIDLYYNLLNKSVYAQGDPNQSSQSFSSS